MTDHATEAAELLACDRADAATAHALLAIAEQLRIANLIALSKESFAAHQAQEALGTHATAKFGEQIGLNPDIADLLGINREDQP